MSTTSGPRVPATIDSPAGKLVYLAVERAGETAVEDLRDRLDMKRVTIYGILDTLASRGLVERVGDGRFAVR